MEEVVNMDGEFCTGPHPLLIPLVVETVFAHSRTEDLLLARMVCKSWYEIGTEKAACRESMQRSMTADANTLNPFLDLMTPSQQRLPVVRWTVHINFFHFNAAALTRFLRLIAPSAIKLCLRFSDDQNSEVVDYYQALTLLDWLKEHSLDMLRLKWFEVQGKEKLGSRLGPPRKELMGLLLQRILKGAENVLVGFATNLAIALFANQHLVIQSLPLGLKNLHFFGRDAVPYAKLFDAELHIEELIDAYDNDNPDALCFSYDEKVHFLSLQKASLCRLEMEGLEEFHRNLYTVFPRMEKVTKIRTSATCSSTFEYLKEFPNVVELELCHKCPTHHGIVMQKTLPQHPTLKKLFIWGDGSIPPLDQMINFEHLSHCFPNLTHLSFCCFTDLFEQFPNLEWLRIGKPFHSWTPDVRGLGPILCGVTTDKYSALQEGIRGAMEAGTLDSFLTDAIPTLPGLTNLKRLRTLELLVEGYRYAQMFTDATLHTTFLRMESLKEICFVEKNEIPEACQPFLDPLRARGIDVYCMKRRLTLSFP